MIETSLIIAQKYSATFEHLESFGKNGVCVSLGQSSENFQKSSVNFGKCSEIFGKFSKIFLILLFTCPLCGYNFHLL